LYRCKWCGIKKSNKKQLKKHELNCEWKKKKEVWQKRVSENKNKTFWYVDTQRYILKPCMLSDAYGMIRFIEKDGKLSSWSQSFKEENLFEDETNAQRRLDYLKKLYFETFKYTPFLADNIITKYLQELLHIEKTITEGLKNYPNFTGIDFCDVSAGGIQIRGHHNQINGYTYGDQPTIKYDFSNIEECIQEFIEMWKERDMPEEVCEFKKFIRDGEKYGWD